MNILQCLVPDLKTSLVQFLSSISYNEEGFTKATRAKGNECMKETKENK